MLETLWHLFLAITAVVVVGRGLGLLFLAVHQPPVVGQIVAGIVFGPSLLGRMSPQAYHYLLPPDIVPVLDLIAQAGVIVYMFLVGVELNPNLLRGQVRAMAWTSTASIAVPFGLGLAFALYLYPRLSSSAVPFTHFSLFIGIAMSITAFPVLARILAELRMTSTKLGTMALTCAAVNDVAAWCLLAIVVGIVRTPAQSVLVVALLTIVFVTVMLLAVRPLLARLTAVNSKARPSYGRHVVVIALMFVSALTTQAIGVHAILGAFVFGVLIPHDGPLASSLSRGFERAVTVFMLPAFFALTGMRTEIGLVTGWWSWMVVALIVLVATAGKFGGTVAAARLNGLDWRYAAGLGVLMNTRGLMELIVLNVGLDLGVVSPTLFTMLVLMALVTTIATTPVLRLLFPQPPS